MKPIGYHIIGELFDVETGLNDADFIRQALIKATEKANFHVYEIHVKKFNDMGVSSCVIIGESHISIHTWPEYKYAALDIFSCKDSESGWIAYETLVREFKPGFHNAIELRRGLLPESIYVKKRASKRR